MTTRDELIRAKGEVQARIASLRRQVDGVRQRSQAATGAQARRLSAQTAELQAELDRLMAEERRLRLEIDRTRRGGPA